MTEIGPQSDKQGAGPGPYPLKPSAFARAFHGPRGREPGGRPQGQALGVTGLGADRTWDGAGLEERIPSLVWMQHGGNCEGSYTRPAVWSSQQGW